MGYRVTGAGVRRTAVRAWQNNHLGSIFKEERHR